jgi:transposase-like protein
MLYCVQMGVVMSRKYRQFAPEFKFNVVIQLLTGAKSITELCREHQLKDSLVYRWRDELLARGPQVYVQDNLAGEAAAQARIAELERVLGRLTMELEALKKASSLLGLRSRNGGS